MNKKEFKFISFLYHGLILLLCLFYGTYLAVTGDAHYAIAVYALGLTLWNGHRISDLERERGKKD